MFFECKGVIYKSENVAQIDISNIEQLKIKVLMKSPYIQHLTIEDVEAINFLYRCFPNALEGRRLRWLKYRWCVHNMIAHPLMQLFSFFGFYKMAIKIHDATIPKPLIEKCPNLNGYQKFIGRLDGFFGQETEGMMVWTLNRENYDGAQEDMWDLKMPISEGDYLKIYDDGIIVWEGFIEQEISYRYGARWWPVGFDKYNRLDWGDFFSNHLSATLYRKER